MKLSKKEEKELIRKSFEIDDRIAKLRIIENHAERIWEAKEKIDRELWEKEELLIEKKRKIDERIAKIKEESGD